MAGVLVWLDALAGLSLFLVAAFGWQHFRTAALFAAAAGAAWFAASLVPALVLLHRPLVLHAVLALPRRRRLAPLSWALLAAGWSALALPVAAQPWAAAATAALAVATAAQPRPLGTVSTRPLLLIVAAGLSVPVVERIAWPESSGGSLPYATYLCAVIVCSGAMIRAMLGSGLNEADSAIELSDRTLDTTLAELRRLAADPNAATGRGLDSALSLLEDNARLQQALAQRISDVHASRARLIDAAIGERQRLERVLADGAQRYLDELEAVLTKPADAGREPDPAYVTCLEEVTRLREDLEQLARGLHPRVLSDRGLGEALEQLARRSPVPVQMRVPAGRFPERTETTMWYACAEALANVWKHAQATHVQLHLEESPGSLRAIVRDDGVGGASLASGGGLAGLVDRLSDVEGRLALTSTPTGTNLTIEVPIR